MAFLVKQAVMPSGGSTWIEHTYEENVQVVNGHALVERQATLTFLHTCGYDLVTELPPLDELEQHPELAVELARMGLGPWAGQPEAELDARAKAAA